MNASREKILINIKEALKTPSPLKEIPSNLDVLFSSKLKAVTPANSKGLWKQFQQELELVNGECLFVKNTKEAASLIGDVCGKEQQNELSFSEGRRTKSIIDQLQKMKSGIQLISVTDIPAADRKNKLANIVVSVVDAAYAVADIGSLVIQYPKVKTIIPYFLADHVIALVDEKQIVANQFQLFDTISTDEAKEMVFMTGPSRTADIEKVLILGAHGPRRLTVIVLK